MSEPSKLVGLCVAVCPVFKLGCPLGSPMSLEETLWLRTFVPLLSSLYV